MLLIGLVCLVTFVHKQTDVLLVKDLPQPVLDGQYSMTYLGQTGDFQTDRNNALRFDVTSKDGKEHFIAAMPFALRAMEGGDKKLIGHPSITHHAGGDLYLALKDGPDEFYPRGRTPLTMKLGDTQQWGPYTLHFDKFERDPQAAAMAMSGQMPDAVPRLGRHARDLSGARPPRSSRRASCSGTTRWGRSRRRSPCPAARCCRSTT